MHLQRGIYSFPEVESLKLQFGGSWGRCWLPPLFLQPKIQGEMERNRGNFTFFFFSGRCNVPLLKKVEIDVPSSPWICQWVLSKSVRAWSSDSTELCAGCSRWVWAQQGSVWANPAHHHPPSGEIEDLVIAIWEQIQGCSERQRAGKVKCWIFFISCASPV